MAKKRQQAGSYLVSFGITATFFLISLYLAFWVGANGLRIPFLSSQNLPEFADSDEKIKFLEKKVRELESELAYVKRSTKVELAAVEEVNNAQKFVISEKIVKRFGEDLTGKTFGIWGMHWKHFALH